MNLIFATRPSRLARWQTQAVIQKLQAVWSDLACDELVIKTRGDRELDKPLPEIGGKGLFTSELEQALFSGEVQAAVHSLKDLPTDTPPGLVIGVVPERADARDVLICPAGHTVDELPQGALVGTSSIRRGAQLLARRPDLKIAPLRGNVDTRLRKVFDGEYDAIVLAAAGVTRLGQEHEITQYLPYEMMLPAPGQGALAVQCRADDLITRNLLLAIEDRPSHLAVAAERAFLNTLGGGCSLPVGAYATYQGALGKMDVAVAAPDGAHVIRLQGQGVDPQTLGVELAEQALEQGARSLLELTKNRLPS